MIIVVRRAGNQQSVVLAGLQRWHRGRDRLGSIDRKEDLAGQYTRLLRRPVGEDIEEHPASIAVAANALQSRVNRVLGQEPGVDAVKECCVAAFQPLEVLADVVFEFVRRALQQVRQRGVEVRNPCLEIDAGHVHEVLLNPATNRFYD